MPPVQNVCAKLRDVPLACLGAQERGAAAGVDKEVFALGHVLDVNLGATIGLGEYAIKLSVEVSL